MGSNCCKGDAGGRPIRSNSSIYSRSRAGASLDERFTASDDPAGIRLTVSAARTGDTDVYTLQASNAAGSDSTRVRVEVAADEAPTGEDPPAFLRRLQDLTVKVGTRTRFLVEIVSSTECKVTWYRNERRLLEAERVALARDGNFWCADVAAVSVDDAGRWTCTAENAGGRASCSAHLNVLVPKAYKRPEFVEELRALLTEQGTVSLECKVVGVPTPLLRWFKDSREIKAGDVFALTANAEDPTSLGTYTCEAVNCMGRAYSSSKVHVVGRGSREGSARPPSSSVTPEPPPIFTKELEDQFVRICEPLTLSCHVVVPPWPRSVVWYNKEGKVEASERYHVLEDGAGGYLLELASAEWPDEGEWKCVATSSGGRVGISTCYVTMDVPKNYRKPRFMENLQAVLTEEGLVSFECKVVGFPTPVLSWFKDGQELKPGDVYQLTGTNSLGSYCCIARNCMGQASSSAELTVEDIQNQLNEEEKLQLFSKNQAPKFIQGLKSVEAKIDEPFRFTIKVAIPPEPSVLWYRDDQPVDESSRCHHGREERGVFYLDIQSLEFLDQAEWKCVAMNDFGHSVTSCFLKLIIPRHYKKPRFLENLQAILSDEGAVNLECKVIGVPQPVLKWYKDGEELKPGDIHRIISGQDGTCCLGTYTCEAQNCMGIAASSASLLGFDDSMKAKKKKAEEQALQRNLSLSTIHEERTSQMYDTPVGDVTTLDDKGEISFSFDGKEVSVSLYETPDLTEEEALQIVEMYADQLSENITEHNVVELPPLRFVKETSTSGNLLMEAVIIDVSPDYFVTPDEDMRTEADIEDISIADENGPPQLSLDQDIEIGGEDYLEKTMALLSEEKSDLPLKFSRKKSDSQRSADDFFSLSRDPSISEDIKRDDDTQAESFASAHSLGKPKSKSSKPSGEDGQESSEPTKTIVFKDEALKHSLDSEVAPAIKPKRERRTSRSSRRSSSGSEKSISKLKEEVLVKKESVEVEIHKKPQMSENEFKENMVHISTSLSKVINDVQIIERDIILKSELMTSAATASRSLEIISSLISPLTEIHSITDAAREAASESKEVSSTLFNNLPQPLKALQRSLTLIEKCIDMESDSRTLVKKTCVAFVETCGSEMQQLLSKINTVISNNYLLTDDKVLSEIQSVNNEMCTVMKFSSDTIKARNLLSEASEIKVEEPSVEVKHLRDTQKAVFELKSPLNSLLSIVVSADSGKIIDFAKVRNSEVILNDMSGSIQDLQTALEQIETLSVKESTLALHKYNTEIIETVMESVVKLRNSFEQLSTESRSEDKDVLKQAVASIKENLHKISSQIEIFEGNVGTFDVLQSENKLDALQKMAQILIALENNLPRLDSLPEVKNHMTLFHKNLTKVLENVIESNESKKYFILMGICDAVNIINASIKNLDVDSILALASLNNSLRIIQDQFITNVFDSELNCFILTNIADTLVGIQEAINSAEETSIQIDSEHLQELPPQELTESKAKIVIEHIDHAIAAIENLKTLESTQELKLGVTPTLENICPVLEELKRSVASIKASGIEEEHISDISALSSFAQTLASPLCELNQNIIVLNQQIVENIESMKDNSEIMATVAEPLHELNTTLEILQHEVISQYDEDLTPYDISINMASAVQNLHSCIVMIQEQAGVEAVDDMSTLEDISGIKTTADTTASDRLLLPTAIETAIEPNISVLNVEQQTTATAQALQTLNEHITILQTPEIIDALDTLSEVSDYSSLKSFVVGLAELHSGIEEVLHPLIMEGSDEIGNLINPSKLTAIAEPMQEIQQSLSVLDTSNIPIYENILEMPTEKIHSVIQNLSEFKKHVDKCMLAVFPAMHNADNTVEIANKVGAIREVCENLKEIIETTKAEEGTPMPKEVSALEVTVDNLLDATDVSKGIKIDQVKTITEELYEKITIVQEEIIQFTPHASEKLAREAKLIQTIDELQNNIAVLEQYDFVDLSRASDLTCTSPQMAVELESDSLLLMEDIVDSAVNVVQDSTQETPVADLMIVEDFFKTCKNEFTILRCLITKATTHKKIIRLLQEFSTLQSTINDFKNKKIELTLSEDINGCLATFLIHADDSLQNVQQSLLKIVDSQSELLIEAPLAKFENSAKILKAAKLNKHDKQITETVNKFVEILETAKPSLQNVQAEILEEIRSTKAHVVECSTLANMIEEFATFVEQEKLQSKGSNAKNILEKISTCIEKHQDYKDASGTGKTLILLKCLSDCTDVLQENLLEVKVPKPRIEEGPLKVVLTEMLEPLQALHKQLTNVQEQVLSGIDEDSISVDITTAESLVQTMTEKHKEIIERIEAEEAIANEEISLILEVDKEIHSIQDSLRSINSVQAAHMVKEITKPVEDIEKSLSNILSSEQVTVFTEDKLPKEKAEQLVQHIDQYIELIEIVEEISAVIKIEDINETMEIAKELRECFETMTREETSHEKATEIRDNQVRLAQKLQTALSALQVQVLDSAQELAPALSPRVLQRIARVTAQLQADLVAVTGIQVALQAPLESLIGTEAASVIESLDKQTVSITTSELAAATLESKPAILEQLGDVDVSTSIEQAIAVEQISDSTITAESTNVVTSETFVPISSELSKESASIAPQEVIAVEGSENILMEQTGEVPIEPVVIEDSELTTTDLDQLQEVATSKILTTESVSAVVIEDFGPVLHEAAPHGEQITYKTAELLEVPKATIDMLVLHIDEFMSVDITEVINILSDYINAEELKETISIVRELRESITASEAELKAETSDALKEEVDLQRAQLAQKLYTALAALENVPLDTLAEIPSTNKEVIQSVTEVTENLRGDLTAVISQLDVTEQAKTIKEDEVVAEIAQMNESELEVSKATVSTPKIKVEASEIASPQATEVIKDNVETETQADIADFALVATNEQPGIDIQAEKVLQSKEIQPMQVGVEKVAEPISLEEVIEVGDIKTGQASQKTEEQLVEAITDTLLHNISEFLSHDVIQNIDKIAAIADTVDFKQAVVLAQELQEVIAVEKNKEANDDLLKESPKRDQAHIEQDLLNALTSVQLFAKDSVTELSPVIESNALQKVVETATRLQAKLQEPIQKIFYETKAENSTISEGTENILIQEKESAAKKITTDQVEHTSKGVLSLEGDNIDKNDFVKDASDLDETIVDGELDNNMACTIDPTNLGTLQEQLTNQIGIEPIVFKETLIPEEKTEDLVQMTLAEPIEKVISLELQEQVTKISPEEATLNNNTIKEQNLAIKLDEDVMSKEISENDAVGILPTDDYTNTKNSSPLTTTLVTDRVSRESIVTNVLATEDVEKSSDQNISDATKEAEQENKRIDHVSEQPVLIPGIENIPLKLEMEEEPLSKLKLSTDVEVFKENTEEENFIIADETVAKVSLSLEQEKQITYLVDTENEVADCLEKIVTPVERGVKELKQDSLKAIPSIITDDKSNQAAEETAKVSIVSAEKIIEQAKEESVEDELQIKINLKTSLDAYENTNLIESSELPVVTNEEQTINILQSVGIDTESSFKLPLQSEPAEDQIKIENIDFEKIITTIQEPSAQDDTSPQKTALIESVPVTSTTVTKDLEGKVPEVSTAEQSSVKSEETMSEIGVAETNQLQPLDTIGENENISVTPAVDSILTLGQVAAHIDTSAQNIEKTEAVEHLDGIIALSGESAEKPEILKQIDSLDQVESFVDSSIQNLSETDSIKYASHVTANAVENTYEAIQSRDEMCTIDQVKAFIVTSDAETNKAKHVSDVITDNVENTEKNIESVSNIQEVSKQEYIPDQIAALVDTSTQNVAETAIMEHTPTTSVENIEEAFKAVSEKQVIAEQIDNIYEDTALIETSMQNISETDVVEYLSDVTSPSIDNTETVLESSSNNQENSELKNILDQVVASVYTHTKNIVETDAIEHSSDITCAAVENNKVLIKSVSDKSQDILERNKSIATLDQVAALPDTAVPIIAETGKVEHLSNVTVTCVESTKDVLQSGSNSQQTLEGNGGKSIILTEPSVLEPSLDTIIQEPQLTENVDDTLADTNNAQVVIEPSDVFVTDTETQITDRGQACDEPSLSIKVDKNTLAVTEKQDEPVTEKSNLAMADVIQFDLETQSELTQDLPELSLPELTSHLLDNNDKIETITKAVIFDASCGMVDTLEIKEIEDTRPQAEKMTSSELAEQGLFEHIQEFTSDKMFTLIKEIALLTNSDELKESVELAKALKESIEFPVTEETSLMEEAKAEQVQLVQKLQHSLSTLHAKALESAEEIAPAVEPDALQRVSEIITYLQDDLNTAMVSGLPAVYKAAEIVQSPDDENSMKQLEELLQKVTDKINLPTDRDTDDTEDLKDTLDEVQTVIIKLKRDYDGAMNDTLNETLEDLECSVRSVQLQINEDSPPELLKEACATLQLLVNNMNETQEVRDAETITVQVPNENILENCSAETESTVTLLEEASKISVIVSNLSGIVSSLNSIRKTVKFLKLSFEGNADALIEHGVDVVHNLDQLEDKVFSLEKDLLEANLTTEMRDTILTAVHSVYGSISNMRGTISSIQKRYMFEHYGNPSETLLRSIKNINVILGIDSSEKQAWKKFLKSLRKVLNHFEDIKFYINLDKTARLPSDAAFTKIILEELKSNVCEVMIPQASLLGEEATAKINILLDCVNKNLTNIESKLTLEVKEKIPIFKELALQILDVTDFLKIEKGKPIKELKEVSDLQDKVILESLQPIDSSFQIATQVEPREADEEVQDLQTNDETTDKIAQQVQEMTTEVPSTSQDSQEVTVAMKKKPSKQVCIQETETDDETQVEQIASKLVAEIATKAVAVVQNLKDAGYLEVAGSASEEAQELPLSTAEDKETLETLQSADDAVKIEASEVLGITESVQMVDENVEIETKQELLEQNVASFEEQKPEHTADTILVEDEQAVSARISQSVASSEQIKIDEEKYVKMKKSVDEQDVKPDPTEIQNQREALIETENKAIKDVQSRASTSASSSGISKDISQEKEDKEEGKLEEEHESDSETKQEEKAKDPQIPEDSKDSDLLKSDIVQEVESESNQEEIKLEGQETQLEQVIIDIEAESEAPTPEIPKVESLEDRSEIVQVSETADAAIINDQIAKDKKIEVDTQAIKVDEQQKKDDKDTAIISTQETDKEVSDEASTTLKADEVAEISTKEENLSIEKKAAEDQSQKATSFDKIRATQDADEKEIDKLSDEAEVAEIAEKKKTSDKKQQEEAKEPATAQSKESSDKEITKADIKTEKDNEEHQEATKQLEDISEKEKNIEQPDQETEDQKTEKSEQALQSQKDEKANAKLEESEYLKEATATKIEEVETKIQEKDAQLLKKSDVPEEELEVTMQETDITVKDTEEREENFEEEKQTPVQVDGAAETKKQLQMEHEIKQEIEDINVEKIQKQKEEELQQDKETQQKRAETSTAAKDKNKEKSDDEVKLEQDKEEEQIREKEKVKNGKKRKKDKKQEKESSVKKEKDEADKREKEQFKPELTQQGKSVTQEEKPQKEKDLKAESKTEQLDAKTQRREDLSSEEKRHEEVELKQPEDDNSKKDKKETEDRETELKADKIQKREEKKKVEYEPKAKQETENDIIKQVEEVQEPVEEQVKQEADAKAQKTETKEGQEIKMEAVEKLKSEAHQEIKQIKEEPDKQDQERLAEKKQIEQEKQKEAGGIVQAEQLKREELESEKKRHEELQLKKEAEAKSVTEKEELTQEAKEKTEKEEKRKEETNAEKKRKAEEKIKEDKAKEDEKREKEKIDAENKQKQKDLKQAEEVKAQKDREQVEQETLAAEKRRQEELRIKQEKEVKAQKEHEESERLKQEKFEEEEKRKRDERIKQAQDEAEKREKEKLEAEKKQKELIRAEEARAQQEREQAAMEKLEAEKKQKEETRVQQEAEAKAQKEKEELEQLEKEKRKEEKKRKKDEKLAQEAQAKAKKEEEKKHKQEKLDAEKKQKEKQMEEDKAQKEKEKAEELEKETLKAEKRKEEENLIQENKAKQAQAEADKREKEAKEKQEEEQKIKQEAEAKVKKEKEEAENEKLKAEKKRQEEARIKEEVEKAALEAKKLEEAKAKKEEAEKRKQEELEAEQKRIKQEEEVRAQKEKEKEAEEREKEKIKAEKKRKKEEKLKQEQARKEKEEAEKREKEKLEVEKKQKEQEELKQAEEAKARKEREQAEREKIEAEKKVQEELRLKQEAEDKAQKEREEAEERKMAKLKAEKQQKEEKQKQDEVRAKVEKEEAEKRAKEKLEAKKKQDEQDKLKQLEDTKAQKEKVEAEEREKEKLKSEKKRKQEEKLKQEEEAKTKQIKEESDKREKEELQAKKKQEEQDKIKEKEKADKLKKEELETAIKRKEEERIKQEKESKDRKEKEEAEKRNKAEKEAEKKFKQEEKLKKEQKDKVKRDEEEAQKRESEKLLAEKKLQEEEKLKREEEIKLKKQKETEKLEQEKIQAKKQQLEKERLKEEKAKKEAEEEESSREEKAKEKKRLSKQRKEEEEALRKQAEEAELSRKKASKKKKDEEKARLAKEQEEADALEQKLRETERRIREERRREIEKDLNENYKNKVTTDTESSETLFKYKKEENGFSTSHRTDEEDHYIREYQYEPSRQKPDERTKFVDHNNRDYTMEFSRPSGYRERTFEHEKLTERESLGRNATIYKAQTILLDSQLRSSVPPQLDKSEAEKRAQRYDRSESEKRFERHKSKALSEARSMITEKRSGVSRDLRRKPVFSTYLTDRTAVEGSRVKLTCSVLSSADPKITWFKNGVFLDNKLKYKTKFMDGLITLEVLNAVVSDSAEYTCTVENENGSVSTAANLKVYPSFEASPIPPTFTRSIRDTYHLAENELVLECRIRGQPLPTITWLKDDKPVAGNERFQAFYLADGVCRLAISSPTPDDSGKYTCKAENSVWSDQINHVVSFSGKDRCLSPNIATKERSRFNRQALESRRPHFTNVLSDYKVAQGGTIGLQVEIRGCPTRVEWLREGRSVTEVYRNARTFVEQGLYTLALSDVTEKESGMYTCRAWSTHGNVDMNAAITVVQPNELDGKPAIIVGRPEKDILISVGEDVNISFRVQGEPKPKVVFMKGIRDITTSQRVCKMTSDDYVKFTLKRSVVSDAGTYCILARNAYGCDRAFVTVVVRQRASSENLISDWTYPIDDSSISVAERKYKSVPERIPGEPSVVDGGSNWVSLAWPKPESRDAAPVLAYRVDSWLSGKDGGARWLELGITPLNSFDAFNLKQGEEYHFRVTPRNRYGWGESVQTSTPIGIGLAGDRPEFVEILPGQLKVLAGETANLSCSVKGKPLPEVIWMKNGHEVEEEGRVTTAFNGQDCSLTIRDICSEDEARYSCEAANVHGRASTYARLAVVTDRLVWEADAKLKRERSQDAEGEYPPQFTMRLRDRRVQATYPVRLTCQVVGNPPPTLTWFKDGDTLVFDSRRTKYQDEHFHTLEIAPTTLDDGGVYEAMARNNSGAVSCRCSLVVDKGIRAYVAPEFCCGLEPLYRLSEGDELRISAVVEAYPSVGVTWYRDGVRLRPSRRAIMTLDRDGQIELALAAVTARDAGVYTCTASNEVGRASTSGKVEVIEGDQPREKRSAPVVINAPDEPYSREPMFVRKPRSSEAREGDTVIIACEVIGDPKPDVYWLRDFLKPDYYRDASHFKRVGDGPEYRFEIPHAKLDYTGAYSVVARNVHGEAKAIISLQILAKDPSSTDDSHNVRYGRVEVIPRFERELTDLLSYDGDAIEFECHVTGNPEPDIRWFHYNELIRDCSDFESSFEEGAARLKIRQVTAEDEGTYSCEASNNLGKATSSACLVVYPPGEPNTLSQRLRRPPALLSAASTPRSTPRSTPARSVSRTPGPEPRRLCSPSRQMPPSFYTYPFNKVVEEGEQVTFKCAVKGLPAPWATWDKDGIILTPSARVTIKEKDELLRILEIEQVSIEDVGVYRITIENEFGRAEASARLEVITQKGKFYGGVRAYSPSPRKSLTYRRYPSVPRQD